MNVDVNVNVRVTRVLAGENVIVDVPPRCWVVGMDLWVPLDTLAPLATLATLATTMTTTLWLRVLTPRTLQAPMHRLLEELGTFLFSFAP